MKPIIVAGLLLAGLPSGAGAVTLYTDEALFDAAVPIQVVIEDFEDSDPLIRDTELPSYSGPGGEISFVPFDSTPFAPNVVVANAGYNNFGAGLNPTTSIILSASVPVIVSTTSTPSSPICTAALPAALASIQTLPCT